MTVTAPGSCPAALDFSRAPYLAVPCHRQPGHDGLHEARAVVPFAGIRQPGIFEYVPADAPPTRGTVWFTWDQDVSLTPGPVTP